jgi:hypothetical protein
MDLWYRQKTDSQLLIDALPEIPGTTHNFNGRSTAEFGGLLGLHFPIPGGSVLRFDDFPRVHDENSCRVDVNHRIEERIESFVRIKN